ncbi:MAG: hypothetical protein SGJ24_19670 [Chloroflexota bacterium]|nr:hypothetical protein [Chloroflexota bacterium]
MSVSPDDLSAQIARYNAVVLLYEALDDSIDTLITDFGGMSENMPPEALEVYRALALQRDDAYNEMRALEQTLQLDDSDS